jgi:hypothetical protein
MREATKFNEQAGDNHKATDGKNKASSDRCKAIHATGTDPRGLGMMQPEGRPQRSESRCKRVHVAGTGPRDLGIMLPEGRPQLNKLENVTWYRC